MWTTTATTPTTTSTTLTTTTTTTKNSSNRSSWFVVATTQLQEQLFPLSRHGCCSSSIGGGRRHGRRFHRLHRFRFSLRWIRACLVISLLILVLLPFFLVTRLSSLSFHHCLHSSSSSSSCSMNNNGNDTMSTMTTRQSNQQWNSSRSDMDGRHNDESPSMIDNNKNNNKDGTTATSTITTTATTRRRRTTMMGRTRTELQQEPQQQMNRTDPRPKHERQPPPQEQPQQQQQPPRRRHRPLFILHVGLPKTATTHLQCSLCADPTVTEPLLLQDEFVYLGTCPLGDCRSMYKGIQRGNNHMTVPKSGSTTTTTNGNGGDGKEQAQFNNNGKRKRRRMRNTQQQQQGETLYLRHGHGSFFVGNQPVQEAGSNPVGPFPHALDPERIQQGYHQRKQQQKQKQQRKHHHHQKQQHQHKQRNRHDKQNGKNDQVVLLSSFFQQEQEQPQQHYQQQKQQSRDAFPPWARNNDLDDYEEMDKDAKNDNPLLASASSFSSHTMNSSSLFSSSFSSLDNDENDNDNDDNLPPELSWNFQHRVQRVRQLGYNAMVIFEGADAWSHSHLQVLQHYLEIIQQFEVHIVIGYRPLFDWLPSKYNSIIKPSRNRAARVWPGQELHLSYKSSRSSTTTSTTTKARRNKTKITSSSSTLIGEAIPPFALDHRSAGHSPFLQKSCDHDELFSDFVHDLEVKYHMHPTQIVQDNYQRYFDHVHIMSLPHLSAAAAAAAAATAAAGAHGNTTTTTTTTSSNSQRNTAKTKSVFGSFWDFLLSFVGISNNDNNDDMKNDNPTMDPLLHYLFCQLFPGRMPQTCQTIEQMGNLRKEQHSRYGKTRTTRSRSSSRTTTTKTTVNPSLELDYDILAVEAYQQGLIDVVLVENNEEQEEQQNDESIVTNSDNHVDNDNNNNNIPLTQPTRQQVAHLIQQHQQQRQRLAMTTTSTTTTRTTIDVEFPLQCLDNATLIRLETLSWELEYQLFFHPTKQQYDDKKQNSANQTRNLPPPPGPPPKQDDSHQYGNGHVHQQDGAHEQQGEEGGGGGEEEEERLVAEYKRLHQAGFAQSLTKHKFCSIDAHKTLQDPHWRQWFIDNFKNTESNSTNESVYEVDPNNNINNEEEEEEMKNGNDQNLDEEVEDENENDNGTGEEEDRPLFVLHVGLPKMATTYLQCQLCANANVTDPILRQDNLTYLGMCPLVCGRPSIVDRSQYLKNQQKSFFFQSMPTDPNANPLGPYPHALDPTRANKMKKKTTTTSNNKKNGQMITATTANTIPKLNPSFVDKVEEIRAKGNGILIIFEGCNEWSSRHIAALSRYLKKNRWDVHIVVGYRPLYEWLPSKYNIMNKPTRNHHFAWTWPGVLDTTHNVIGEEILPFALDNRSAGLTKKTLRRRYNKHDDRNGFGEYVHEIEVQYQMHPTHMLYHNYRQHFDHVHIMSLPLLLNHELYQETGASPKSEEPLLEFLFCQMLSNRDDGDDDDGGGRLPATCRAVREGHMTLTKEVNEALSSNRLVELNYDILAVQAYKYGWIPQGGIGGGPVLRHDHRTTTTTSTMTSRATGGASVAGPTRNQVRTMIQQHKETNLTNVDFPLRCLDNATLDRLESLSWLVEQKFFFPNHSNIMASNTSKQVVVLDPNGTGQLMVMNAKQEEEENEELSSSSLLSWHRQQHQQRLLAEFQQRHHEGFVRAQSKFCSIDAKATLAQHDGSGNWRQWFLDKFWN